MNLTRQAIRRPVLVLMAMIATIMMGFISFRSMRQELNPDVAFGVLSVVTVYPGAGPEEVNNQVTRKIEDAVAGLSGVRAVNSVSQDSVSAVVIQFEIGSDMQQAQTDTRTRIDRVLRDLPTDAERPVVEKFDTASDPVMTLSVASDKLSPVELRDLADNELRDRFARLPGVGTVTVSGGDVREIQVRLRRDDLLRFGVGVLDVQQTLQAASVNVPSGRITSGEGETVVRVLGEANSVQDLENLRLQLSDRMDPNAVNREVRLGDVADIVDTVLERRTNSRLDGQDAVLLTIQKTKEGTAVEISNAIRSGEPSFLKQLEAEYGLTFAVTLDQAIQIKESLFDLQFALGFGILLVVLTIWVFLHSFRGTMIVAIAIPLCIFATLIAMKLFGFTINNLSVLALSLAVGVLVDDAIVIIENTYRHLAMGEDPEDAAINGRAEIGTAAIAITLADVVVFLPIAFMGGIVGQFYRPLGIGYAVCVLFSLLVSFTVTPMLAARWFKKGENFEHIERGFPGWFNRKWNGFANWYAGVLANTLKNRWTAFGAGFAILFALFQFIGGSFIKAEGNFWKHAPETFGPAMPMILLVGVITVIVFALNIQRKTFHMGLVWKALAFALLFPAANFAGYAYRNLYKQEDVFKFAFLPPSDAGRISILIETAPGSSLKRTEEVVAQVESKIQDHPDVHYVISSVGARSAGFAANDQGSNLASITVVLWEKEAILDRLMIWVKHEEPLRKKPDTEVVGDLLLRVGRIAGADIKMRPVTTFDFGSPIQIDLLSENRELATQTAIRLRDALAAGAVEGVVQPDVSSKPGNPELRAIPIRDRAALAGVSTAQMGLALRTLYEGNDTVKLRERGLEYDIRVQLAEGDRQRTDILETIPVAFERGRPIFLAEVARLEEATGVVQISRTDRRERIQVTANLLPGVAAGTVQADIDRYVEENNLIPEGVTYKPQGQADAQARESGYLFGAIILGLILVYLVLASLYNNLLYPFIIQLAQPQAMVGALLALMLTDKTLNIIGMIGIVAMIGLVGKNAILLVDYTNTLRERGMPRFEALVESGRTRLRPIFMTTIALLVGLLPVALAIGRGSEFRETIGITIIGGTVLSTVLTLLVIPCSYSIFDDLSQWLSRRKASMLENDSESASV